MKKNILIVLMTIIIIMWMNIIYVFSATPSKESNIKSSEITEIIVEPIYNNSNIKNKYTFEDIIKKANKIFRKFAHATVYLVLAVLLNIYILLIINNKIYFYNLLSIVICFLYACTDEFHQTFVVGRTGQFSDVLIDTIGSLLGCLLFNLIYIFIIKINKRK